MLSILSKSTLKLAYAYGFVSRSFPQAVEWTLIRDAGGVALPLSLLINNSTQKMKPTLGIISFKE